MGFLPKSIRGAARQAGVPIPTVRSALGLTRRKGGAAVGTPGPMPGEGCAWRVVKVCALILAAIFLAIMWLGVFVRATRDDSAETAEPSDASATVPATSQTPKPETRPAKRRDVRRRRAVGSPR